MNVTTPQHECERPPQWKVEAQSVRDKRALVTGGTTGIGRTIAMLLAHQGAHVFIFSRDEQHVRDASNDLSSVGKVEAMTANTGNETDLDRVFEQVDARLGGLDILINNAGVSGGSVADDSPADYRKVIETNIAGYLGVTHRAIPLLAKRGGDIINIGSMSAKSRGKGSDVYVATKSAIRGWSDSLAKQLADEHIRVTLIEPGLVGADIHDDEKTDPQVQRRMNDKSQMLYSESIAEAVLYVLVQTPECHIPMLQIQPLQRQSGKRRGAAFTTARQPGRGVALRN